MQWQTSPVVLVLFLCAVATFSWGLYGLAAIRAGGRTPYLGSFVALSVAVTVWTGMYAVQVAAPTLEAKLLAYKLLHVGAVAVPPAWVAFALTYSGRTDRLTPAAVAGLVAIPAALLLALPTNPYSLALTDATLQTRGSLSTLVTGNGPLYMLYLAYGYVTIAIGVALIVGHAIGSTASIRRQAALIASGALVPLALNVADVFAVAPAGALDVNLTPISLALSTALFGLAIFRFRMFDLTPIARATVFEQMSDGAVVLDARERILDVNPTAEALFGNRASVLGADASSTLPRYDRLGESPQLAVIPADEGRPATPVESDRTRADEVRDATATRGDRLVQLVRSPVVVDGETCGWVVLSRDVTILEGQRRKLARKNERLDAFADVVSHDLRNPLAVIDGYAELASETGEKRHFEEIHTAVSEATDFLEELLDLSRRGETVAELEPVALPRIVERVANAMTNRPITVRVGTDDVVMADEGRLRQVFDNLFRNALDHGEGAVTVTVGSTAGGDGFFVEDDGPGIAPAAREDLFEVGFSTRTGGSGFGLAIVRDVVDAHGWSISVEEGRDGGARFVIGGVDVRSDG